MYRDYWDSTPRLSAHTGHVTLLSSARSAHAGKRLRQHRWFLVLVDGLVVGGCADHTISKSGPTVH